MVQLLWWALVVFVLGEFGQAIWDGVCTFVAGIFGRR